MKRIFAILLCFALALSFAGCGSSDDPHIPTGDGLTWDEDYTGPMATRPTEEQELTLTYYPNKSMNPLLTTDFTNRALFSLIYQSLFSVDRNYNVEPILCKQYSVSEDMKTYTFFIEDATFSDGSVLTIKDVEATLLAAKESEVYKGRFKHVSEIVAAGGSLVITLNTAYENLPILLDIPILKRSQLATDRPLGTGPYFLEAAGSVAQLQRRTDWWCKVDNMTITADSILLVEAEDNAQIRDQFEFFDLDLVCADPGSDRYADYRCDYELWDCENNIFLYLGCNMYSAVFSDPTVRAALPRAIDRDKISSSYYRGFARSAALPASPLSPYYNHTLAARYEYDGGESLKNALAETGKTGAEIYLLVNSDDTLRLRVARDIRDMLTQCGLTVTVTEKKSGEFQRTFQEGGYDIYLGQTRLSANMDLSNFFSSSGSLNHGSIHDVALYTLCLESLANHGNFYTLHQSVMNDGRLCPILFRSYAIYATRGLLTDLTPARENVFYYSLGKTMEKALIGN